MANTLDIALSGLRTASTVIGNESHNIANALTPGYTKKNVYAQTQVLDGKGNGVASTIPQRSVDQALLSDEREKISTSTYLSTKGEALDRMQQELGRPGEKNSLSEKIKNFSNQCEALSLEPTSSLKRKEMLRTLEEVTGDLARLTGQVQKLRQTSDQAIKAAVDEVNTKLQEVDSLNKQIITNTRAGLAKDDLLDQRDSAVRIIAQHMDIVATREESGGMYLRMGKGTPLLFPAYVPLEFSPTTYITPQTQYDPDPILSGVSHITQSDSGGNVINVTEYFKGGSIAANVEIRDRALTNLQAQLDLLATELRDKINADHNLGVGYPPATTLTGTRAFDAPLTDLFQGAGTLRVGVVDKATGTFVAAPYDLDLGVLGAVNITALAANLNVGLGANGNAAITADGQLTLGAANPNHGIALVPVGGGATENGTGLGFSHYFGLNDLITSQDESYAPGAPVAGLAGMLGIRGDILAHDALLSRGQISDAMPTPGAGAQAIYNGDNQALQRLITTFETPQAFANVGELGDRQLSFADYASAIIGECVRQAVNAENLAKNEQSSLENVRNAQGQISGVDTQESLLTLLDWQQIYMGCSTVIGVEKENFHFLMQIL